MILILHTHTYMYIHIAYIYTHTYIFVMYMYITKTGMIDSNFRRVIIFERVNKEFFFPFYSA